MGVVWGADSPSAVCGRCIGQVDEWRAFLSRCHDVQRQRRLLVQQQQVRQQQQQLLAAVPASSEETATYNADPSLHGDQLISLCIHSTTLKKNVIRRTLSEEPACSYNEPLFLGYGRLKKDTRPSCLFE